MKSQSLLAKTAIIKAISNPKRLEILHNLNDNELSVGKLEDLVKLSQSAISQHLSVLRRTKVVKTRRNAQTIYYSIDNSFVAEVLKLLNL